jgi:anti-anti-sigma factor
MSNDGHPLSQQPEIQRHTDSHGAVVTLRGELDLATAPELERVLHEIMETQPGRILIDLRRLLFIDCTGLSPIIRAQQHARANGYLLALRRGPPQVQRLFQLTELLGHFTFLNE